MMYVGEGIRRELTSRLQWFHWLAIPGSPPHLAGATLPEYLLLAFEMEGPGVWDNFPTVVIKGGL